jgi:hypothetical protein
VINQSPSTEMDLLCYSPIVMEAMEETANASTSGNNE